MHVDGILIKNRFYVHMIVDLIWNKHKINDTSAMSASQQIMQA